MPHINFVTQGRGPVVVLSHALGCDLSMWDEVAQRLARHYTVLRYDHRGHGQSQSAPGPWSIENLADDAAALIDRQVNAPVHFVGLSMGGMVAQQIAVRHPQLVSSIVVANSSSHYDDTGRGMWRARIETARNRGMTAVSELAVQRWFTPAFRAANAARVAQLRRCLETMDEAAYTASCEAIARIEFCSTNPRVACPALVIAGEFDEATPPAMADIICRTISGAVPASIAAAHLSAVENPDEFSRLVMDFITSIGDSTSMAS